MPRPATALLALALFAPSAALAQTAAAPAAPAPGGAATAEDTRAEPSEAALAFASEFADDHLSGMLSRIGGGSDALRTLSQIDGRLLAVTFDAHIDAAVARHSDAWTRNLAIAWSPLLTDAEMESLVAEGADSPHTAKYLESREPAAARMAEISQELFTRILQETVRETVAELIPETPPEAPAK